MHSERNFGTTGGNAPGHLIGRYALYVLFALVSGSPGYGLVTGTVADTSGKPVIGSSVRFTDETDPERFFAAVTDRYGSYEIGVVTSVNEDDGSALAPEPFRLGQNYPNPFNPSTILPFSLPNPGVVNIAVYNIRGQKVRTVAAGRFSAGNHTVIWNGIDDRGNSVSSGVYLCLLRAGNRTDTKKMLLLDGGSKPVGGAFRIASEMGSARPCRSVSDRTYRVTITGADIEPYVQSRVSLIEGNTYCFVVTRIFESIHEVAGIKMLSIPGGSFRMGGEGVAEPVHEVTISAFEMGAYEITQSQYNSVAGSTPSYFTGEDALPVERVTWWDAISCCNALSAMAGLQPCYDDSTGACDFTRDGFRLPTEAEWEYACRAGTTTRYPLGDALSDRALSGWFGDNSGGKTHAVGRKAANAWGLYDMPGNVWEWCHDRYGGYPSGSQTNPSGATDGSSRVIRGGGWGGAGDFQGLSAYRDDYYPEDGDCYLGFRVVRSVIPAEK